MSGSDLAHVRVWSREDGGLQIVLSDPLVHGSMSRPHHEAMEPALDERFGSCAHVRHCPSQMVGTYSGTAMAKNRVQIHNFSGKSPMLQSGTVNSPPTNFLWASSPLVMGPQQKLARVPAPRQLLRGHFLSWRLHSQQCSLIFGKKISILWGTLRMARIETRMSMDPQLPDYQKGPAWKIWAWILFSDSIYSQAGSRSNGGIYAQKWYE